MTFLEGYSALAALSLSASTVSLHEYKIIPKLKDKKFKISITIKLSYKYLSSFYLFSGICGNYSLYSALSVSPGLHLRSLAR